MPESVAKPRSSLSLSSHRLMLRRSYLVDHAFSPCRLLSAGLGVLCCILLLAAPSQSEEPAGDPPVLRVCADPNNLPFSNQQHQGFENKIAELLAKEMGGGVAYTWWPQRRGFLRGTLNAGRCEVVMGVPAKYELVLTTRPYYQSTYAFVYRSDADYRLTSLDAAVLRSLRIGVHLIGDDYTNSPPAHALSQRGLVENVVGYSVYGNYAEDSPPGKIVAAVAAGEIDTALVWGPIAGYFAQRHTPPLRVTPLPADAGSDRLPFRYDIAMGVRRGNHALKAQLDALLVQHARPIRAILQDYGVPLLGVETVEPSARAPAPNTLLQTVQAETTPAQELSATTVAASNGDLQGTDKNPFTGDPTAIAEGKEYYKMLNCYGCHGMRGGGGMGPSINDAKWSAGRGTDADIMQQIMEGRGKMPSYKDSIDPDQAWKIIAYVRSLYRGSPDKVTW